MPRRPLLYALLLLPLLGVASEALALDGQVLIDHNKALAGNVTPGDAPGYPVTLSVQGSYKLSGNLSAPAGVNGIDAAAVEVTIDLNGFRIEGSNAGNFGIYGTQRNLRVLNGTIQRFKRGIVGGGSAILEDLRITENSNIGIEVSNGYARISDSTVIGTANGSGISCSENAFCQIENSKIAANRFGVTITGGMLHANTIMNNAKFGVVLLTANAVGIGENTIAGNVEGQISGTYIAGMDNACSPAC